MEKEKKREIHITNNFNAPIGQHIDHVDNISLHMDARGGIQIVNNPQRQEAEVKPPEIHNQFESGSNCQVFNAPISGCVFAMPGSNVTQEAGKPTEEKEMKDDAPMPDVLASEEAQELLECLADADILTKDWKPVGLSATEKGELAMQLALKLDISNVWQVFGSLWGMKPKTLRAAFNRGRDQKKNAIFQDRLKNIMG